MPIYAYRCTSCGHAQDVLQKMSDPVLTVCPACGADSYAKQLTAAGFQLKGSGWYVTDFRGGKKPEGDADKAAGKPADKPGDKATGTPSAAGSTPAAESKPAAAPAPAAPAAPTSGAGSGG
jgi:putative FmdB family regulatory protein